jgi:hypothetical protein
MQTLVVDTNGIVKKLEPRSFSRAQAEGITEALKELDTSTLVMKSDLEIALDQSDDHYHQVDDGDAPRARRPHRRSHPIL